MAQLQICLRFFIRIEPQNMLRICINLNVHPINSHLNLKFKARTAFQSFYEWLLLPIFLLFVLIHFLSKFSCLKYCVYVTFKLYFRWHLCYMCMDFQVHYSVWAYALNMLIFKRNFRLSILTGLMYIKKVCIDNEINI